MGMVSIDASEMCLELLPKFPWKKFDNISFYFHGGNLIAVRLKCVIAHKTLFSPSFHLKNMAIGMPYFHGENLADFRVWCAIAHRQSFVPVYMVRANMLMLG